MRIPARVATPAIAAGLLIGAVAAPLLRSHLPLIALSIRWFYAAACHQRTERSLFLLGAPLAVCARCTGIYAGAIIGALLRLRTRPALFAVVVALLLNGLDISSELSGMHGNLPWLRLVLGMALGAAVGVLLASRDQATDYSGEHRISASASPGRETQSALR